MVPYLTLLERKVLSYIQLRKGPNKVRFLGLLQPIRDGIKLFTKSVGSVSRANIIIFWFRPLLNFFFMLILFIIFVPFNPAYSINLRVLLYLCVSSLLVYTILLSGWRRNSKYSFLGSLRGAAQVISYEIVLLTILFFPLIIHQSFKLIYLKKNFSFV
jgi:NADH-ubiquinone oxidoreductase chain 1